MHILCFPTIYYAIILITFSRYHCGLVRNSRERASQNEFMTSRIHTHAHARTHTHTHPHPPTLMPTQPQRFRNNVLSFNHFSSVLLCPHPPLINWSLGGRGRAAPVRLWIYVWGREMTRLSIVLRLLLIRLSNPFVEVNSISGFIGAL